MPWWQSTKVSKRNTTTNMILNPSKYNVFSSTDEEHCFIICSNAIRYTQLMDAFLGNDVFEAVEVTCHTSFVLGDATYTNCNVLKLKYIADDDFTGIEIKALAEFIHIAEEKLWTNLLK